MALPAAKLLIDIAANVAGLRKDFAEATGVLDSFGSAVTKIGSLIKATLGALAIGQVVAFAERIAHDAAAMSDMADNLKLTVDEFQAFNNAAYLAGQSAENVATALGKFNVFIGKAAEGSKEQIDRLNELGVKILDVGGKLRPQADVLQEVATAITHIADPARRAAAEVAFFGKSGQAVSAILNEWAKGQEQLNKELEMMGLRLAPEVIKQLDELADKTEAAQKRIDILLAPAIAVAKSWIATALEDILRVLTELSKHSGAIDQLASIARIISSGDVTGSGLSTRVRETATSIAEINNEIKVYTALAKELSALGVPTENINRKLQQLQEERTRRVDQQSRELSTGFEGTPVLPATRTVGTANPAIKSDGVDKYAEALKKLQAEIDATNAGIKEFSANINLPSKEAERESKATVEAGKRLAGFLKDLPAGTDTTKIKEKNEELKKAKMAYDDLVKTQQVADEINTKYSDGTKELADRMFYLNKALAASKISQEEYDEAVKDANKTALRQKLIHEGQKEGIEGLAAGFKYGMDQMAESVTAFSAGQELFQNTFHLMSNAITEFVKTGTINFANLAKAFADMLLEMTIKWLAAAALKSALKWLGSLGGAPSFSPGDGSAAGGAMAPAPSAGYRATGGDVWSGRSYMVGESGPERFVPPVPGTIVPNNDNGGSITVNVAMGTTDGASNPAQALEFGRRVKAAVVDVITNEKRPGGTLYNRKTA